MSAQTSYNFGMPYGCAGGIVDLAPRMIETYKNGEATGVMGFGRAVVNYVSGGVTSPDTVVLPSNVSDKFEGITVNNRTTEYNMEGQIHIINKAALGVMRYGKIYVKLDFTTSEGVDTPVTVAFGQPCYVSVASGHKGLFSATAANNMPINARFVSEGKNGIAMVELMQKDVLDLDTQIPTASATVLGGVKVGSGLTITDGVLSTTA